MDGAITRDELQNGIRRQKLMVVDSDVEYLKRTRQSLAGECQTVCIRNKATAIDYLSKNVPDLIFVSTNIGENSVDELIKWIAGNSRFSSVWTIVLIDNFERVNVAKYFELGVREVIFRNRGPFEMKKWILSIIEYHFLVDNFVLDEVDNSVYHIDEETGIINCGGRQTYLTAVEGFVKSIDDEIKSIAEYYDTNNIREYVVKVHALKSSARLIGAIKLSELAAHLEQCGKENNFSQIDSRTDELISICRKMKDNLANMYHIVETDESQLCEITDEKLLGILGQISEANEEFDLMGQEECIKRIEEYRIPAAIKSLVDGLKASVRDVDYTRVEESISKIRDAIKKNRM